MPRQFIINKPPLKHRRRQLRNQTTPAEKILWSLLSRKQLGFWFKRQVSIYSYVVDFYCPKKHLVIELDGSVHKTLSQEKYDSYRTRYINALNIKVLRLWNKEVVSNPARAVKKIKSLLNTPPLVPPLN